MHDPPWSFPSVTEDHLGFIEINHHLFQKEPPTIVSEFALIFVLDFVFLPTFSIPIQMWYFFQVSELFYRGIKLYLMAYD